MDLGGRSSIHLDLAPCAHHEEFSSLDLPPALSLLGAPRDLKDIAFVFIERCFNLLCDSFQTYIYTYDIILSTHIFKSKDRLTLEEQFKNVSSLPLIHTYLF